MGLLMIRPGSKEANTALSSICSVLQESEGLVRVAVAYFNHPDIADSLLERTRLGRKTELLLNASDILRPEQGKVEITLAKPLLELVKSCGPQSPLQMRSRGRRVPGNYSNMHHKFMVSENVVLFGTVNWTTAALQSNYEILAKCREPEIVEMFWGEFQELWEDAPEIYIQAGKIRSITCPYCDNADGVDFESYGPFCTLCGKVFVAE